MKREPSDTAPALAYVLSVAASIGLIVVYLRGGDTQWEGALIAIALGGLGLGLALWSKRFVPQPDEIEEREPLESEPYEFAAAQRAFAQESVTRRRMLRRLLAMAGAAFGAAMLFPIRSLGPRPGDALVRTAWRRGLRLVTADGAPVRVDDLVAGGTIVVWPEGRTDAADSQTVLIRLEPEADPSAPVVEGYVAYSRLCTHAGCPVGLYQAETHELFCPCHQSAFDVLRGAQPISGPATRPLPQLRIEVDEDGFLRALDDFEDFVGPAFWRRT